MNEDVRAANRALAETLRRAGLNTRALAAWAGTDRISALPSRLPELAAREPTTAAAALAMFVGGARVPARMLGLLGDALAVLATRGLVEIEDDRASAKVAIIPLRSSLFVCDRLDTPVTEGLVCWPDDSSHHLAACLPPGRREKWLDLGCGSGFAPLARPELAASICGTDINARALDHAAIGAALSGVPLEVFGGDVGADVPASWRGTCELVSCNAPMPSIESIESIEAGVENGVTRESNRPGVSSSAGVDASTGPAWPHASASNQPAWPHASASNQPVWPHASASNQPGWPRAPSNRPVWPRAPASNRPVWRHAAASIVERMVDAAARFAANGATIVIHAAHDALAAALASQRGDRTIVRYTPDGVPGFAVAWWQPDGDERLVERTRLLTPDAPHLTFADGLEAMKAHT